MVYNFLLFFLFPYYVSQIYYQSFLLIQHKYNYNLRFARHMLETSYFKSARLPAACLTAVRVGRSASSATPTLVYTE